MKSLFKIFTILPSEQYKMCAVILLGMIIGAFLEVLGIGAIFPLISVMGNEKFLEGHQTVAMIVHNFGILTHTEFIAVASIGLMCVYWLKNIYLAWQFKIQVNFAVKNQVIYSRELMKEYLLKPYLFHVDHNTALLIRNVNNGAAVAFSNILVPTFALFTEIITAIAIWFMLLLIDYFTAIVVALLLLVMVLGVLKFFRRKIVEYGIVQRDCAAVYMKWINQSLGAIKEIKIMHREDYFLHEFDRAYDAYCVAYGKFNFINQLPRMIIESFVVSGIIFLIIIKIALGNSPMEIVPLLGVLALAAFRLMPSANRIVSLTNGIKFQYPLFEELYNDFLNIRDRYDKCSHEENDVCDDELQFSDSLSIQNISFKYPGTSRWGLKDITFHVKKGNFVGIIGQSGAGKTTFVDILLGLIRPDRGKITVDGSDICDKIVAWQKKIAYVPQNIYLIDGTIRENIALGLAREDVDEEQLIKALKMSELFDYVMGLPEQLDTNIGERGVRLSGGQRQRIGICRALFQQPEILILDEATSALDMETEKYITDTLVKLKGKITILAIAHRLSTLEMCDFKVKFVNGIIEKE